MYLFEKKLSSIKGTLSPSCKIFRDGNGRNKNFCTAPNQIFVEKQYVAFNIDPNALVCCLPKEFSINLLKTFINSVNLFFLLWDGWPFGEALINSNIQYVIHQFHFKAVSCSQCRSFKWFCSFPPWIYIKMYSYE